jgi:hypothetical protein
MRRSWDGSSLRLQPTPLSSLWVRFRECPELPLRPDAMLLPPFIVLS